MVLGFLGKIIVLVALITSCVSMKAEEEIPVITGDMTIKQVVEIGVRYGNETFSRAKEAIKKRRAHKEAHAIVSDMLLGKVGDHQEMWRLVNLFQASSGLLISPKVVEKLISSEEMFVRQLGWRLASNRPSDLIATVLERHLTRAVLDGEEEALLLPEMALAAKANRLSATYSLLKMGLMKKGGVEFVEAMNHISPSRSSNDFMDYLALATIEDLRQMNQKTIDLQTCLAILKVLVEKGVPLGHPKFEHLFLYAVSRNAALAELASAALEKYMPLERGQLAFTLARLPVWVQLAYVESTRDRMNATIGLFLGELKIVTAHREVIEEIISMRR